MSKIFSGLGIFLLLLLSRLPMRALYSIARLFYFILYKLIKYRLKVVKNNLEIAFPGETQHNLKIEKSYYRFLSDLIVESIKGFSISDKELKKRVQFSNPEIYDDLFSQKQNAIVVMGHKGNWEWICRSAPLFFKNKMLVAYKPLTNQLFDEQMKKMRSQFGSDVIPMSKVPRVIATEKEPFLLILLADQSPSDKESSIWTSFFNRKTAVLPGPEKLAKKHQLPVYYIDVIKLKRGYYRCDTKLLIEKGTQLENGLITEAHVQELELAIKKNPEIWIWSHRRWKLS